MNTKDILMFVGVALTAYMLLMRRDEKASANEIDNPAMPGQVGYGWRYFGDGTAIAPDGTKYRNGQVVLQASYDGVSVGGNYFNLAV